MKDKDNDPLYEFHSTDNVLPLVEIERGELLSPLRHMLLIPTMVPGAEAEAVFCDHVPEIFNVVVLITLVAELQFMVPPE